MVFRRFKNKDVFASAYRDVLAAVLKTISGDRVAKDVSVPLTRRSLEFPGKGGSGKRLGVSSRS
jgi:hypothetical protein